MLTIGQAQELEAILGARLTGVTALNGGSRYDEFEQIVSNMLVAEPQTASENGFPRKELYDFARPIRWAGVTVYSFSVIYLAGFIPRVVLVVAVLPLLTLAALGLIEFWVRSGLQSSYLSMFQAPEKPRWPQRLRFRISFGLTRLIATLLVLFQGVVLYENRAPQDTFKELNKTVGQVVKLVQDFIQSDAQDLVPPPSTMW